MWAWQAGRLTRQNGSEPRTRPAILCQAGWWDYIHEGTRKVETVGAMESKLTVEYRRGRLREMKFKGHAS